MRVVFVRSAAAKEKLRHALYGANVERTMLAPVTAILGFDLKFADHLQRLFPGREVATRFVEDPNYCRETAILNGTLQAAYLMLSARSCGLDVGPMSGFDRTVVDKMFFEGSSVRTNLLCNMGFGDSSRLSPRNPRLTFDEACRLA